MTGRVTAKGTKPKAQRRRSRIKGHYPLPGRDAPAGIVAPGMVWRRCSCGSTFGGATADRALELHCRFGPRPAQEAPCCQEWDLDETAGWRTVRTCGDDCQHDHEHYGERRAEETT